MLEMAANVFHKILAGQRKYHQEYTTDYSANVLTLKKKHQISFKPVQTLHQNYFDVSPF
jgi:hypothetical protein